MAPSSGVLKLIATTSSNRRAAAGVDHNPLAMTERRGQARVAVAPGDNFRTRPNFRAQLRKRLSIFGRGATGEENSRAIDLFRKL